MKVTLTAKERDLLVSFLSAGLSRAIENATPAGSAFHVQLSDEEADEIRDACGDQLQRAGFDEKYELTAVGEMLETLVDKLFVG
ncbi:MAG TPA: hypothetical protein VGP64_07770 [Polyangia bacterium]|jgi:hypothetical protein